MDPKKSKKNIEDEAIVTDQVTLTKKVVERCFKPFVEDYRKGKVEINKKLDENTKLLKRINGSRTRGEIINDFVNKAAIIFLFILFFNQCANSDTRKPDIDEKVNNPIEVIAE